ncbi:MAG TPA: 30S ribosomal protein S6 [Candidatus Marinimicrobia bacterium]|nr:30S ribosomal protein S6 [Candidatus Neomarinimicrobiota bacterium]
MRYYETLYILNPEYEQERIDNILKEVEEEASKFSKVINHSVWNKKRLAYPVDNHKYGFYVLLQFESEDQGSLISFDNYLKLNKFILRYQSVRIDAQPEKIEVDDIMKTSKAKQIIENSQENIETEKTSDENKNKDAEEATETVEEETSA